jgi:hypothetical protein
MTTYSQNDANNLHDSGKFYGQTVATLINQIYPQQNTAWTLMQPLCDYQDRAGPAP